MDIRATLPALLSLDFWIPPAFAQVVVFHQAFQGFGPQEKHNFCNLATETNLFWGFETATILCFLSSSETSLKLTQVDSTESFQGTYAMHAKSLVDKYNFFQTKLRRSAPSWISSSLVEFLGSKNQLILTRLPRGFRGAIKQALLSTQ